MASAFFSSFFGSSFATTAAAAAGSFLALVLAAAAPVLVAVAGVEFDAVVFEALDGGVVGAAYTHE